MIDELSVFFFKIPSYISSEFSLSFSCVIEICLPLSVGWTIKKAI